ncbi:MAG TPA: hypothetical protein ENL06_03465 [Candidatus Portnoybacteria bacterium]|nr:hypothetical protein [Candidatus Portnoybacteria bacterium]
MDSSNSSSKKQFIKFLIKGSLINAFFISLPLVILIPLSIITGRIYHHQILFIIISLLISMIISGWLIYKYYQKL